MTRNELNTYLREVRFLLDKKPIPIELIKEKTAELQKRLNDFIIEIEEEREENIQRGIENDLEI